VAVRIASAHIEVDHDERTPVRRRDVQAIADATAGRTG
jgi:hypothetical protein